jgi:hypothetical protein
MKQEPVYVTLDATGNGEVTFRARKPLVKIVVRKVTIEMEPTSSGTATLGKNGSFLTSMPVAPTMEAYGDVNLYTSEYMTGRIQSGPVNTQVKFMFHYDELPANP